LGFGLLQGCASGQCASLLSLGLLHRITVFSGDFADNVRHKLLYIKWKKKNKINSYSIMNNLRIAVLLGDLEYAKECIEKGDDVNGKDTNGNTP